MYTIHDSVNHWALTIVNYILYQSILVKDSILNSYTIHRPMQDNREQYVTYSL